MKILILICLILSFSFKSSKQIAECRFRFEFNDSISINKTIIYETEIDSVIIYSPISCVIYLSENKIKLLNKIDTKDWLIYTKVDGWVNGGVTMYCGDSIINKIGYRELTSSETPSLFINTENSKLILSDNNFIVVARDSVKNLSNCILGDLFYMRMKNIGKIKSQIK